MGLSNSILNKAEITKIDSIIESMKHEICQEFSAVYLSEVVISQVGIDSNLIVNKMGNGDCVSKLITAPTPRNKIKVNYPSLMIFCFKYSSNLSLFQVGMLTKRGENFKSWKKRWFHAYNKLDNFIIKYTVDEGGCHEKGKINCFGYSRCHIISLFF